MVNKMQIKKYEEIIDSLIAREFRVEAKEIMMLTTNKYRNDLIKYLIENQGNICCLVIDAAKRDLINSGINFENNGNAFGNPL
jgi:predicted nucleic-acid-binding protein